MRRYGPNNWFRSRTRLWASVAEQFQSDANEYPRYAPMAALVEALAVSPYTRGLYPVTSHDRLRLFQSEWWSLFDDEISIEYRNSEFVVEHHLRSWPRPMAGEVSVTRGTDGLAAFEAALRRSGWFIRYQATDHREGPV